MSSGPVFCPKCGQQSTDGLRYCRNCGTNLEVVSRALTGALAPPTDDAIATELEVEYAKEFSRAAYNLLGSLTVFVTMLILFRAEWWVFFLLFWVGSSVRDVAQAMLLKRSIHNPAAFRAAIEAYKDEGRSERRRKRRRERHEERERLAAPPEPAPLPAPADRAPTTGELAQPAEAEREFDPLNPPPSVTEGTTDLLPDRRPREAEGAPRYSPPRK